jgi:hypothetical protein
VFFEDVVEAIFAAPTKEESLAIIEYYDLYWMEIIGTRGFKGKKAKNANTMFNALFEHIEFNELDPDEDDNFNESKLDQLDNENK